MVGQRLDKNELLRYIEKFPRAQILVIGDIILDEYIWGKVSRISPEAPVPVVEIREETRMLGGAANVISNLASLGAKPFLCGVIGKDRAGDEILGMIKEKGLETDSILVDKDRPTSIKTRVIAHDQQVVRFDKESRKPIDKEGLERILDYVSHSVHNIDVILISDYGKGVVSRELIQGLRSIAQEKNIPIAVDPKVGNFHCYEGVDILTPNSDEASSYCRFLIEDNESLIEAGRMLMEELSCASVLITRGKDGMTLFQKNSHITHIPAVAKQVYDVTGAGDTVIATLAMGIASGMDLVSSAIVANFAGGIVVGKVGTSTVTPDELRSAIMNYSPWLSKSIGFGQI